MISRSEVNRDFEIYRSYPKTELENVWLKKYGSHAIVQTDRQADGQRCPLNPLREAIAANVHTCHKMWATTRIFLVFFF